MTKPLYYLDPHEIIQGEDEDRLESHRTESFFTIGFDALNPYMTFTFAIDRESFECFREGFSSVLNPKQLIFVSEDDQWDESAAAPNTLEELSHNMALMFENSQLLLQMCKSNSANSRLVNDEQVLGTQTVEKGTDLDVLLPYKNSPVSISEIMRLQSSQPTNPNQTTKPCQGGQPIYELQVTTNYDVFDPFSETSFVRVDENDVQLSKKPKVETQTDNKQRSMLGKQDFKRSLPATDDQNQFGKSQKNSKDRSENVEKRERKISFQYVGEEDDEGGTKQNECDGGEILELDEDEAEEEFMQESRTKSRSLKQYSKSTHVHAPKLSANQEPKSYLNSFTDFFWKKS